MAGAWGWCHRDVGGAPHVGQVNGWDVQSGGIDEFRAGEGINEWMDELTI